MKSDVVECEGYQLRKKWDSVINKIVESQCGILYLQETKKESFDSTFVKKFYPPSFDKIEYQPSQGASGGMAIIWKSALFDGELVFSNEFAISVKFTSTINSNEWVLTNAYGPCTAEGKRAFMHWFKYIQMLEHIDWLIVGDFNLIWSPDNRNKPGDNYNDMFMFNDAISTLALVEIPLLTKQFTWSNKQQSPSWSVWTGFLHQMPRLYHILTPQPIP